MGGGKIICKQLNANHTCLARTGCCFPIPEEQEDAAEVALKRERMREQLLSGTAHSARYDFPL